jgi:hypothetical protein
MRLSFLSILFLFTLTGFSQPYVISGKVTDAVNGQPLAFVGVIANGGPLASYTDIDGRFRIAHSEKITSLRFSYLGYLAQEMQITETTEYISVRLYPTQIELDPVLIKPGLNPAHRIIGRVLENRDRNDPEKLKSFSYTAYEKTIITPSLDSLFKQDTVIKDTSLLKLKDFFGRQDMFIFESVYERKFEAPDKDFRNVLANRVSGLQDPIFPFIISQLQPGSFYREVIPLGEKNYINPISKGCFSRYYFHIEDTLYDAAPGDTTYLISFRPLLNRNFDGLKGVLYINTDGYALQSIIASPARAETGLSIRMQQLYSKVDGKHWFPVQLNTDIDFLSVQVTAGIDSTRNIHFVGVGKTYLRDIQINPEIPPGTFSEVQLNVHPEANFRTEEYWNKFRQDSLSIRDLRTYAFMDSIGKAENLDQKMKFLESLATGKVPVWKFDIDLDKLFRFNPYEGWFVGLGVSTNRRFSETLRLGAYTGYGFGDNAWKYGGEAAVVLDRQNEVELVFNFKHDVFETGGIDLFDLQRLNLYERFRNFLINRMDIIESYKFSLRFRTFSWFLWNTSLYKITKTPTYDYTFSPPANESYHTGPDFTYTQWVTSLRFAYREKFLQNARTKISIGTNYPIVQLQYAHGFKDLWNGQFAFDRLDVKISQSFFTKYLGKTTLTFRAGLTRGVLPVTEMYNGNASFYQFAIFAMNSFATMRMNEFTSDRYLAMYLYHSFGKLLVRTKYFEPEIAIASHFTIGALKHPEYHQEYSIKTMEKGYYESGLLLNKLISLGTANVGLGAFYRYGPYSLVGYKENISYKFSIVMPF